MLKLSTDQDFQKAQEALQKELAQTTTHQKNTALASNLNAKAVLDYDGRRYDVPPVPYPEGIQLQKLLIDLEIAEKSDEQGFEEMQALYSEAVTLFHRLVRPRFWLRRLLWRWMGNPFETASEGDIARLIGFFSACRMRSYVQFPSDSRTTHPAMQKP